MQRMMLSCMIQQLCCAVLCCVLLQYALRKLRGEHDAVNVCVAGTVSAGFLGATCETHHRVIDCVAIIE